MAFEIPKIQYTGKIKEITLGKGDKAVTVGGESSYPFHLFEGEMPHKPKIAMEVYDMAPEDWADAALEPFKGVTEDPVAWAKKCAEEHVEWGGKEETKTEEKPPQTEKDAKEKAKS